MIDVIVISSYYYLLNTIILILAKKIFGKSVPLNLIKFKGKGMSSARAPQLLPWVNGSKPMTEKQLYI